MSRFPETYCSQCGAELGPGDAGVSCCADHILVERAAKAAGYASGDWLAHDGTMNVYHADGTQERFDPLNNDGDALRLAVKLELSVRHGGGLVTASAALGPVYAKEPTPYISAEEQSDRSPNAATRRAIVRAAAEIGKL